jgi:predicted TIM-barrel fold metal-dependent hydrolase
MDADNDRRMATRTPQSAWWGTSARNVRDLATAAAPALMHERMDELGLDFAVLYPTKGFGIAGIGDDELRTGVCRGFNAFYAATYGPYADRLTTAGVIPMHTPTEALEALDHCADLGFKVVAFPEGVTREIPEPVLDGGSPFLLPGQRHWFDSFGLDSAHDYDPVWAKARELGFAVTFHGGLGNMPTGSFTSVSNYSFNHVGSFAQRMHTLVKSLSWAASPGASRTWASPCWSAGSGGPPSCSTTSSTTGRSVAPRASNHSTRPASTGTSWRR